MKAKKIQQERQPQLLYINAQGTKQLTLTLWKKSPSLNEWNNKHWRVYYRIKQEWWNRLGLVLNGKIKFKKARVLFHRYACRELDETNMQGGVKPIEDGLVHFNLIEDDSSEFIDRLTKQTKVTKRADECTVIIVEELKW